MDSITWIIYLKMIMCLLSSPGLSSSWNQVCSWPAKPFLCYTKNLSYLFLCCLGNKWLCMSLAAQSCLTLCNPMDYSLPGSPAHWGFFRQEYWNGSHALLQGISPTQGSNPGLPHSRQILNCLSHQVCLSKPIKQKPKSITSINSKHDIFSWIQFCFSLKYVQNWAEKMYIKSPLNYSNFFIP